MSATAIPVSNPLNLGGLQIENFVVEVLSTRPAGSNVGRPIFNSATGNLEVHVGANVWKQASGGSVSSVGLALPAIFNVTTATVTDAGVLTATLATQASNRVWAGPTSGVAAAPSFRNLDPLDIPTLLAAKISDFATAVRSNTLDQMAVPIAPVNMNGQRLTGLPTATTGSEPVTFSQFSVGLQGLSPKPSAQAATTGPLTGFTYNNGSSGFGATLTADANGATVIDGWTLLPGKRVLVKNQTSQFQNGLYYITQAGSTGQPTILTRDPSMDTTAEIAASYVVVENEGTANANSQWVCTTTENPVVGSDPITFSQLNGATQLSQGFGITISGNTVSIATNYPGGVSIVTVGTVTAGTWQATPIAVAYGGTGGTTPAGARAGIGATGRFEATIGDGATAVFTFNQATHGLASDGRMVVAVYELATDDEIIIKKNVNRTNGTVTVKFAVAPGINSHRVVILG